MNIYSKSIQFSIFIVLVIFSEQNISFGIAKIIDDCNFAFIRDANDKYINILSTSKIYVVNKEDNSIKYQKNIFGFMDPFLLYMDKSKNYFLLTGGLRYSISLNDENEFTDSDEADSIPKIDFFYIGYIIVKTLRDNSDEFDILDSMIYGLNYNGIYFYSTSNNNVYSFETKYDGNFYDINLSCKQIKNNDVICISSSSTEIKFIKCIDKTCDEIQFSKVDIQIFYDGFLYDTLETDIKLYCSLINCANLIIEENTNNLYEFNFGKFISLPDEYNSNCQNIKYCDFTIFLSEYLFCCPCYNYVICTRITDDFELINYFILFNEGANSFLTLINNINNLSILFINGFNVFKKNIYPPHCKIINKEINKEVDINLSEFFEVKKDSNYFLVFKEFNEEILMIKLNEEIILNNDTINLNCESYSNDVNFKFILNEDNIIETYLNIKYTISIEETYSSTCSIHLNINHNDNNVINQNKNEEETYLLNEVSCNININPIESLDTEYKTTIQPELTNINIKTVEYSEYNTYKKEYTNSQTSWSFEYDLIKGENKSSNDLIYNQCKSCSFENNINESICLLCDSGYYLFILNNSCLNTCPTNYILNEEQNVCIPDNLIISMSEFKNQIIKNISSCINSTNIINGTDFIAMIYSVGDINPKEQLIKGISAVDLGNCTNEIKNYYNISSFIVLNIESKKNKTKENDYDNFYDLGKNTYLEIYNLTGEKLNLSICQENIKIMKYIGDEKKLDIQSAKNLANQGIDVFNAKDKFFNDLCYYYDNKEERDIIIDDRRKDIYQNATFCQYGCDYDGIDYELMSANCICDVNSFHNIDLNKNKKEEKSNKEKLNFDSIKKSFISNLYNFNFEVMKCYNLDINPKILKVNIGFYFMLGLILFQIIFLIIYSIKGLKSIKHFMISFKSKHKKNNLSSFNKNFGKYKNEKENCIKNEINIEKKKKKFILHQNIFHNYNSNFHIKENKNERIKKHNQFICLDDLNNDENIGKISHKKAKRKKKIHHIKTTNKIYTNEKGVINFNLFQNNEDLEDIDFEKAIIYDKRNFFKMYFAFLVDSQTIIQTFCTDNYLNLFIIKLSFFIYTLQISFFLNTLFYTDEYISNAYYNNGVLDFISGLPKSIYSSVVTMVTTNLLRKLSNNKDELKQLIREKRNNKNYRNLIKSKLKILKHKLIGYFIIVFILGLFFSYYVTSFCAVYRYSQKYLFFGFFESFVLDSLISIITSMILTLLRYCSIKKKIKCIYKFYNIIDKLFSLLF